VTVALPYEFDTSGVVKLILRGMLGLLAILVLGILYSLVVSRDSVAALGLLVSAAIVAYFGRLFLRNLIGSMGTITADAVIVRSPLLVGIPLAGPVGRFSLSRFQAVRVDRITHPVGVGVQIGPHERVYLAGRTDTPDILIARTDHDAGRTIGNELAAALRLPYQEQVVPY
jgi:hypothetical protein